MSLNEDYKNERPKPGMVIAVKNSIAVYTVYKLDFESQKVLYTEVTPSGQHLWSPLYSVPLGYWQCHDLIFDPFNYKEYWPSRGVRLTNLREALVLEILSICKIGNSYTTMEYKVIKSDEPDFFIGAQDELMFTNLDHLWGYWKPYLAADQTQIKQPNDCCKACGGMCEWRCMALMCKTCGKLIAGC